jgi:ethanolamine ammonia-lyase large subunit
MKYSHTIQGVNYHFNDLKSLLAKATPLRSGDQLAGVVAESEVERVAAQMTLADLPLKAFLQDVVIPYEDDEITRLIVDGFDSQAFAEISHLTVGEFRNWLLDYRTTELKLSQITSGITPEMVAAVSKIMRNQDLILVSSKCSVISKFRTTIGEEGRFSTRLQPNHPTDDHQGIFASMLDGVMLGAGDAVIGINPATDSIQNASQLLSLLDDFRLKYNVPMQSCVLTHVTNSIKMIEQNAPVDLIFQSIGGSQKTNQSFGVSIDILDEAYQAGSQLSRGTIGNNFMYFETGQGSSLSANAHAGVDQQTLEVRAYALARKYQPLLVNTVVGFIGPEYLYDGKQITRAGLEDVFCGRLLGLPMGCDVCYTNHAQADQNDMDNLLTLLAVAGCGFIMGVPGADDIMLNYQSTSFHDALYVRQVLGLKPAPEFEEWLNQSQIMDSDLRIQKSNALLLDQRKA